MPRIEVKGEAKEEKKEKSGAWERKKVSHAPNRDKRGSQGREKGKERGMGEEKSSPCPELRKKGKQNKRKRKKRIIFNPLTCDI